MGKRKSISRFSSSGYDGICKVSMICFFQKSGLKRKEAFELNRRFLIFAAAVLAVSFLGIGTGWTVAWLTSETKSVRNVFTVGAVRVQLTEDWNTDTDGNGNPDAWEGILVPGTVLTKNPVVTVPQDCEDCWVYVQLQESALPQDSEISYAVEDGWNVLPGYDSIWFRETDREDAVRTFPVLKQNQVVVNAHLTKQELASIGKPELTVTAYAIQRSGFDSPESAWTQFQQTS